MNGEYRVYDTEQKRYVTDERMWFIATDGTLYCLKTENAGLVKAHNCVVEWATGLTDDKKNKIFDGDILRTSNKNEPIWYVDYKLCCFCVNQRNVNYSCRLDEFEVETELEVIGNIHDNPELLKA